MSAALSARMNASAFLQGFDACVGHAVNAEPGKYYKDGESAPSLIVAADGNTLYQLRREFS